MVKSLLILLFAIPIYSYEPISVYYGKWTGEVKFNGITKYDIKLDFNSAGGKIWGIYSLFDKKSKRKDYDGVFYLTSHESKKTLSVKGNETKKTFESLSQMANIQLDKEDKEKCYIATVNVRIPSLTINADVCIDKESRLSILSIFINGNASIEYQEKKDMVFFKFKDVKGDMIEGFLDKPKTGIKSDTNKSKEKSKNKNFLLIKKQD